MTGGLHDAFVDELRDAYDAEKQLIKGLAKLAKASTSDQLREAFEEHLEQTRGHVAKLEQVFGSIDEKVRGKHCEGIAGIIKEAQSIMGEDFDDQTMDASLVAAAQRSEHYEMAAYGTLAAWAKIMGHSEAADLLDEILEDEKAADEKLSALAESGINQQAVHAAQGDGEEEDEEEQAAPPTRGRTSRSASGSRKRSSTPRTSRKKR